MRKDTYDYRYTEGAASETKSLGDGFGTAPVGDLVLRWTDSDSATHDGNFECIFTGPITVEGGDGFTLEQYRQPNAAHLDAVILDVTINDGHLPADNVTISIPYGDVSNDNEVELSWYNMDPAGNGSPVTVDVWFGTSPDKMGSFYSRVGNALEFDGGSLGSVPVFAPVAASVFVLESKKCYWQVDTYVDDGSGPCLVEGSVYFFDVVSDAPAILSLIPADDATSASANSDLVVVFNEDIALVAGGTVTIKNLTDATAETITLLDTQVSVSGNELIIDPSAALEYGTNYAVQISSGAIVDLAATPNAFVGFLNDTTWNFMTIALPPAVSLPGDINVDGKINIFDLLIMSQQ